MRKREDRAGVAVAKATGDPDIDSFTLLPCQVEEGGLDINQYVMTMSNNGAITRNPGYELSVSHQQSWDVLFVSEGMGMGEVDMDLV